LTESDLSKALMLDGTTFEGRELKINRPKPKVQNENGRQ